MSPWLKIAFRNLYKNGRRSLVTIIAIGVGFASVNVFAGFASYMFKGLRDCYIYGEARGHLNIFKKGYLTSGRLNPTRYLIQEDQFKKIEQICAKNPDIILVSGRLYITGLLSNGQVSTIMAAIGHVPSDIDKIRSHASGLMAKIDYFDGKPLKDEIVYGAGLSFGLAEKLGLKLGSEAIAMAPTVEGQINAFDLTVRNTFESENQALDDKLLFCTLEFAQSLYDTTGVDSIGVLLTETGKTDAVKETLEKSFSSRGLEMDVETWEDLSPMYVKTRNMFNLIFFVLFIIVLVMVVMSVINTMSMAVVERTREIGTLRALGVKRGGVVRLFAYESALLGVFGSILGLFITISNWIIVRMTQPTWIPPTLTKSVPLEIHFVVHDVIITAVFLVLLSIGSAIWPARKAARMNIVDALGHV